METTRPTTMDDVARVRELLSQGVSKKAICEQLGLTKNTITKICNGWVPTGRARRSPKILPNAERHIWRSK